MSPMPLELDWRDIALRLALTLIAGALIGFNREEHGRPAGLRTTLLVCLAAAVAMIQANALLPTAGRATDSFVTLDLMRLPLGILSGVGFLGAGVIFRRSDLVVGVTTAAILWISTVIGLCFGGGQIAVGAVATVLGITVLWGLERVEPFIRREQRATLVLTLTSEGPSSEDVSSLLIESGYWISAEAVTYREHARAREVHYEVRWRASRLETRPPKLLTDLAARAGVEGVAWYPPGMGSPPT